MERGPKRSGGFTLIEILIAMLILAIGMMVALSMQFTALGAASEARDNANASEVAKRVIDIMRVEAQRWRDQSLADDLGSQLAYEGSSFDETPLLSSAIDNAWGWTRVFSTPVDARLSTGGNTRYCAYVAGGYLDGAASTGVVKLQVAVVYPGVNEAFPDGECFETSASQIATSLDPSIPPTEDDSLQLQGFRANYFGAVITQRGYLP